MKQMLIDPFPLNHISFQVSALQNLFFTVSMETGGNGKILR